jgi:hypothetical protein
MTIRKIIVAEYGIIVQDIDGQVICLSAQDAIDLAAWVLQQKEPLLEIVKRTKKVGTHHESNEAQTVDTQDR